MPVKKPVIIHMPHPGHVRHPPDRCQFRLNTYVNGYIVSTIGEMRGPDYEQFAGRKASHAELYRPLSTQPDSFYETMVFRAKRAEHKCCPYRIIVSEEMETSRYADEGAAVAGHDALVKKYAKVKKTAKK